jgi:hypothetical protein
MACSLNFTGADGAIASFDGHVIGAVGDSLTASTVSLLADHYKWPSTTITAVGGDCVADQGNKSFMFSPAQGDKFTLWLGTNDKTLGADDADKESNTQKGHLAILFQLGIKDGANKVRANAMSSTGTWTALGTTVDPRGKYSSTNGSTLTASVSGTTVALVGWWNASQAGQFSVTIDGVSKGTFSCTPAGSKAPSALIAYGPFALTFGSLSDTSHTVVITVASSTNASNVVYVSFVAGLGSTIDPADPRVLVGNTHEFTAAANTERGITAGRNDRYKTIISDNVTTARGLGINASLVDVDAVLADADLGADGVHPTQAGYIKVRDAFISVIDS